MIFVDYKHINKGTIMIFNIFQKTIYLEKRGRSWRKDLFTCMEQGKVVKSS